jgi:hypothetical protein
MSPEDQREFAHVIEEGVALQHQLPWLDLVAVGGTAAALHCTERQAVRDFLDVAALGDLLGADGTAAALRYLNVLYEGEGNQTALTRFAEVTHQAPLDLGRVDLGTYKGIRPPYSDWAYVARRCREIARTMLTLEMRGEVATTAEEFLGAERRDD